MSLPSPCSSIQSSSSDSSYEFQSNLMSNLKAIHLNSYQSDHEMSSVMTRSATRKYASVGAIHNRINFDEELQVTKRWSPDIAYPIPDPPTDQKMLKDLISRSLVHVMSFCKNATVQKSEDLLKAREHAEPWELDGENANVIDLSPYLTQEPVIINGSNETQITLHVDDTFMPHQFINIISLNNEEQSETLLIHEDNEVYDTITLHSDETYLFDNKYFSNTNNPYFTPNNSTPHLQNIFPDDPMMAVRNDHTYAQKNIEKVKIVKKKPSEVKSSSNDKEKEFNLDNVLNDLLLNTIILKCLICGDTPQEMVSFLEKAQTYY